MSTFERAKQNILRDMAASKTHTAESWAQIMLNGTSRLTDPADQTKFWEFMQNPTGEEYMPPPVCGSMGGHVPIERPDTIMCPVQNGDDEKTTEVTLENTYFRNGMSLYIQSKPVSTDSSESLRSRVGRLSICETLDEKTDSEML